MAKTRVFKSGNSLAVRLPKELAFPDGTEVEITRSEDGAVVLRPAAVRTYADLVSQLRALQSEPILEALQMRPEWPLHRCPPGHIEPPTDSEEAS